MQPHSRPIFQRVLVLHPGALGDLLLSLPACRDLRAAAAEGLTVAGKLSVASMLKDAGEIDEADSFDAPWLAELFGPGPNLAQDAAGRLARYDLVVSWAGDGDGNLPRRLARFSSIRSIIDRSSRFAAAIRPLWESYRLSLNPPLPAGGAKLAPIHPGPEALALGAARLRREGIDPASAIAMVHPGAGNHAKRWDIEGYEAVGRALAGSHIAVIVLEGPAEPGLAAELARRIGASARAVIPETILELAGILASCSIYVGNDSGPTHLAAALGVPTVAVYRSSDPRLWSPWGPKVSVVSDSGDVGEVAGKVIEAAQANVE